MGLAKQDNLPVTISTRTLGDLGERLAAEELVKRGYRLVMANFTVPIGRNTNNAQITGEIDLIALDGETLCFIEVKTRSSDEFASPLSAVDLRKQRQIIRTARVYRRIFGVRDVKHRYDIVTVVLGGRRPVIELFKGFWNEARFKKRVWTGDIWENA
ncbi:MAG: YraN family protein [Pyrinomonadaceae bacterium]